jgi:thiol-disulfide isomerase/thioredoxin
MFPAVCRLLALVLLTAGCAASGASRRFLAIAELPAETLDGRPYPLGGPGPVRLVDVWASWCAPCVAAAPRVARVLARHPEVVGLSLSVDDDPEALRRHLETHGVPGLALRSTGGFAAASRRGVSDLPLFLVLDSRGRLAGAMRGLSPQLEPALERMIRLAKGEVGEPR